MKTDKIAVSDLFEKPRRYLVPIFQRGYVWNKDEQWEPLWKDIVSQAVEVSHSSTGGRPPRKHFLGAVVLSQANVGVRQQPISEVIDGQQRITTLQLILAALRDVTSALESEFLSAKLTRLTENPPPWVREDERFKIWPTNAFQAELRKVMTTGSVEKIEEEYPYLVRYRKALPRPPLVEAYLYFAGRIREYLSTEGFADGEDDGDTQAPERSLDVDKAEVLLDALTRHVQLVEINLEAEDDPQTIFETLNARGVPLQPSDLIRNFVFLAASRRGLDVDGLYEKYWRRFDEDPPLERRSKSGLFWKDEQRQGRLKTSRLDLLFFHYLTYRRRGEFRLKHIFQEFREFWEEAVAAGDPAPELDSISRSADAFRQFLVGDRADASPLTTLARTLRDLDTSTVYPLLLLLHDRAGALGAELHEICVDLESYLVRRAICGLTPKNYNRVFLALLRALEPPTSSGVRDYLLELEGESTVWPSDELFRDHWINSPMYDRLGPRRTQMVLERLEQCLRTAKQERIELLGALTVEHIMPQGAAEEDWPLPAPGDAESDVDVWSRRQQVVPTVGNLTLLTQWLNSSIRNGPFSGKRGEIAGQSALRLNSYFQRFRDDDVWDEQRIRQRADELFVSALRLWPHPGRRAAHE